MYYQDLAMCCFTFKTLSKLNFQIGTLIFAKYADLFRSFTGHIHRFSALQNFFGKSWWSNYVNTICLAISLELFTVRG